MSDSSAVFFPLRTSVELFADPTSPAAVTRAKEAALLYERLIFEVGLLDVTIGDTGSSSLWIPPEGLTPERVAHSRVPVRRGAPFSLAVGKQRVRGEPAEEITAIISGQVSVAFAAEWHSGILDELAQLAPDWVESIDIGGDEDLRSELVGTRIDEQNRLDRRDATLLAGHSSFERSFVYKGFNRDSSVAMELGAAFSITPLFNEMIEKRGAQQILAGDQALSILVPNVGALPWTAVLDFREHPGCQEAREMLRGFELRAAGSEPQDAVEYLRSISQEVTRDYQLALNDQRPKLTEELAKEVLKSSVSFVPAVGPLVASVATTAQLLRTDHRQRRSWTAAIMCLHGR